MAEVEEASAHAMMVDGTLPADALRKVFSCLDWHSLCSCSCTCRTWYTLASEDALWQQHLATEYYRPRMLQQYSLLTPPQGNDDDDDDDEPNTAAEQQPAPRATDPVQAAAARSPAIPGAAAAAGAAGVSASPDSSAGMLAGRRSLKDLFATHKAFPASRHQALLARFHAAMKDIHAWRLMIRLAVSPPTTPTKQCTAQQHDRNSTSTNQSNRGPARSSSSSSVTGHPAPLTLSILESGWAWCVGCVVQQQQEQSCWAAFSLPAALKQGAELAAAAAAGRLAAVVQGLGPEGWFYVAPCSPFSIQDDDMDILLQSHKTGFYAWDQAEEDGPDRHADLEPLPWNLTPGTWQQQQQHIQQVQQQEQRAQQQNHQQQQQQDGPRLEQVAQQALSGPAQAGQQQPQQQQSKLRMLVYIHYEQLLQMVPWQLPQSLPVPERLCLPSLVAVGQHLAATPAAALWVHIDVCQLHGSFRLGSCLAPLSIVKMGPESVTFEAQEERVLVALYSTASSMNSSSGMPQQHQHQQQGQVGVGAAAAAVRGAAGSHASGLQAETRQALDMQQQCMDDESCEVLFVGKRCIVGSSNSSRADSEGLVVSSAADALQDLMSMDEVMVDFALFDGTGRLLLGRAGVELWSKECVTLHPPPAPQQQQQPEPAPEPEQQAQEHQQQDQQDQHAAPAAVHAGPITHTRTLQMLHFLVDGVTGSLWENGITVDAAPAPAGVRVSLLVMRLTWQALRALFNPVQQAAIRSGQAGPDCQLAAGQEEGGGYDVGDAMQEMMAAMAAV